MKTLLLILTAASIAIPLMAAGADSVIAGLEKQWVNAVLKSDKAALAKLVGEDLIYTHSTMTTENKQQFIDAITRNPPVSIEFKDPKIRTYGGAAVVTHEAFFTAKTGVVSHIYVTHVWAKGKDGWQLVSRQATRYPEK